MKDSGATLGIRVGVTKKSVEQVVKNLERLQGEVLNAAVEAIDYPQDLIFNRAMATVPVDTGTLRDSHFRESDIEGNVVKAIISVGGAKNLRNPDTGLLADMYAVERHESAATSRAAKRTGGTWKWLEKSVNSVKPVYEDMLAARMRQVFAGIDDPAAVQAEISQAISAFADKRLASQAARRETLRKQRTTRRRKKGITDAEYNQWLLKRHKKKQWDKIRADKASKQRRKAILEGKIDWGRDSDE